MNAKEIERGIRRVKGCAKELLFGFSAYKARLSRRTKMIG
jgi:hypothetical protein